MKRLIPAIVALIPALWFTGCVSIPRGAVAENDFQAEKYLGKWYEIARFDFTFEKNLDNTTAEYAILENGYISVTNRGYNYKTQKWQQAEGKARFRGSDTVAELEVSFFGPFYAGYNVISLDNDYRYALVAGSSTEFLWILSRTRDLPPEIRDKYISLAKSLGYETENLIWVEHNKQSVPPG